METLGDVEEWLDVELLRAKINDLHKQARDAEGSGAKRLLAVCQLIDMGFPCES